MLLWGVQNAPCVPLLGSAGPHITAVKPRLPRFAAVGRGLEQLPHRVLADREERQLLQDTRAGRRQRPSLETHRAVLERSGVIERAAAVSHPDLAPLAAVPVPEVH